MKALIQIEFLFECLNNSDNKVDAKQCNCRSDKNCPLNGKCCRNSIVYKAFLKTGKTDKFYYGSCETLFKLRYNSHKQSFKDNRKINSTKLSKTRFEIKTIRTIYLNKKLHSD